MVGELDPMRYSSLEYSVTIRSNELDRHPHSNVNRSLKHDAKWGGGRVRNRKRPLHSTID